MGLAFPKPARGSSVLAREERQRKIEKAQNEVIAAAKTRDGHRCRWPEKHTCRGFLEGAHITAKGMGGDPQLIRTTRGNIICVCAWIHRRGPETLEHHELKVEPETTLGTDGRCSFWRQNAQGEYEMVARERLIGLIERD